MKNSIVKIAGLSLGLVSSICSTSATLVVKNQARSLETFMGLLELIEGTNDLTNSESQDPVVGVQHLVSGVVRLIQIGLEGVELGIDDRFKVLSAIDEFREQINLLVCDIHSRKLRSIDENQHEHQKLVDGLTVILHNVIYILIEPQSISSALAKILSGIYMVVSAILADGKIDTSDWGRLLSILASILNLKYLRNLDPACLFVDGSDLTLLDQPLDLSV